MASLDTISSSSSPTENNGEPLTTTMSCSEFYTKRVRYLEQFRQRVELCKFAYSKQKFGGSLSNSSITLMDSNDIHDENSNMARLGRDMISLLEKDVQLTEQLINLNCALEQLKACFNNNKPGSKIPLSNSCSSLNSVENDEQQNAHKWPPVKTMATMIAVDDEELVVKVPSHHHHHHQSFDRQNSVLRIPIKRNSQRRGTVDLSGSNRSSRSVTNKRIVERASCPQFEPESRSNLHSPNSDSGMSSSSLSGCNTMRYNKGGVNVITTLEGKNSVIVYHGSQNSFDSGVHSASPEEREEIFV